MTVVLQSADRRPGRVAGVGSRHLQQRVDRRLKYQQDYWLICEDATLRQAMCLGFDWSLRPLAPRSKAAVVAAAYSDS